MIRSKGSPRLETANTFRHGLFNCFFEEDYLVRADALKSLSFVVEYWTQAWLNYQHAKSAPTSTSHAVRPPLGRQSSNGSGISHTPPPSGNVLRRDSSFRLHFDDMFDVDGDEASSAGPQRKQSFSGAPLTPENDDGWGPISGECAISPSESSGPFFDSLGVSFSNKGIAKVDSSIGDIASVGKSVSEEVWGLDEMKVNLDNFYTWLLRFSIDCPFHDVRKGCKAILRRVEKMGARIPQVPGHGPSYFVPYSETIGLSHDIRSPGTPSIKSPSPYELPSEDEDDGVVDSAAHSDASLGSGITIPDPDIASPPYGDRARSRSRGRAAAGSMGRHSGSRRATAHLASVIFQTTDSSSAGPANSPSKHRANTRKAASKYPPKAKMPSEEVKALQMNAYMRTGRVGNLNRILFSFPKFAEVCREATDLFLSEDSSHGPLPQTWRIYLGILAAAEKGSQYYLSLLAEKFLTVQGDKDWLKGLQYAPQKLQRIGRLNFLLAHMPWKISCTEIKKLVRCEEGEEELGLELRWTMAEVVQACLVLSFYHAKAGMALGWGIVPEPDLLGGATKSFIEKGTPVAPFGSFAQSASMSTEPLSEMSRSVKTGPESSLPSRGSERTFVSLLGRKRESGIPEEQDADKLPEKWRKTPRGSVPNPSRLATEVSTNPVPVPSLRKGESYSAGSANKESARVKNQKRRKSFDECATSDDVPQMFSGLNGSGVSLSAPNSFAFSTMSNARPLMMAPHQQARDYLLSPSSSTSSVFESASAAGEQPPNRIIEDHARFLTQESLDRKIEDCNLNSDEYEFLPMEDFEWGIASSLIADYLDGTVELLDGYFKEALEADAEDDELFSSRSQTLPSRAQAVEPTGNGEDAHALGTVFDEFAEPERADRLRSNGTSESRSTSVPARENKSVKEAAWYYSLRLLNIQKDDFRYSDIKFLLDKGARRYLKRVCIQPEMISHADWMSVQGMKNEEKCLLSLLACQARFLGEVLWGLKGCSDFIG